MSDLASAIAEQQITDAVRGRPATVTALPGGGKATIKFAGSVIGINVPHLQWYTPVVADVVMVLQFGSNQYLILGKVA